MCKQCHKAIILYFKYQLKGFEHDYTNTEQSKASTHAKSHVWASQRHLIQAWFYREDEKCESELTKRVLEGNFKGGSLGKIWSA